MKVALITNAPSVRSGIGDYTRHLLPYLAQRCEVEVFVQDAKAGETLGEHVTRRASELDPARCDRILYQLGNEGNHAFMAPLIQAFGGTSMQHDWVLFDMAVHAFPALARGGAKGAALALREGGAGQLRTYLANWIDRRRERKRPYMGPAVDPPGQGLLWGWHGAQDNGRWTADRALLRLAGEVASVTVTMHSEPGRRVTLSGPGAAAGHEFTSDQPWSELTLDLSGGTDAELRLDVAGVRVTKVQRAHGDTRRLGVVVERVRWTDSGGKSHELDLAIDPALPIQPVYLSRDRFNLPLNRSIVRGVDSAIVHSNYVADHIRATRRGETRIAIVPHGAERRWHDEPRAKTRADLGLAPAWREEFMVVSFGGVQAHKRIDRVLAGLALARKQRGDIRLALVGSVSTEGFDARVLARCLGLEDAVHFAGFVAEEEVFRWLHAGDVGINLRGPTSGGTSGGIYQSFAFGRPLIVSNAAEQAELPDAGTLKVPLGEGEAAGVAEALIRMRDDAELRSRLEAGAKAYVDDECHWSHCAKGYADALESFGPPRPKR